MKAINSKAIIFLRIISIIVPFFIEGITSAQGFNNEYSFNYDAAGNRIGVIKLKSAIMIPELQDFEVEIDTYNAYFDKQLFEDEFVSCDEFIVSVHPVPFKKLLYINISSEDKFANYQFGICDISGKNVMKGKLITGGNSLDVFGFPDGIYILKIIYHNKVFQSKIIKE